MFRFSCRQTVYCLNETTFPLECSLHSAWYATGTPFPAAATRTLVITRFVSRVSRRPWLRHIAVYTQILGGFEWQIVRFLCSSCNKHTHSRPACWEIRDPRASAAAAVSNTQTCVSLQDDNVVLGLINWIGEKLFAKSLLNMWVESALF